MSILTMLDKLKRMSFLAKSRKLKDGPKEEVPKPYAQEDFELVDRLHKNAPRAGGDIDLASMPHFGQVVIRVWTVDGIIENGGLQYLFESNFKDQTPYAQFASDYKEIGAMDCANALVRALALFPSSWPPQDQTERFAAIDLLQGPLDELSEVFFSSLDRNVGLLAAYIRAHDDVLKDFVQ